MALAMPATLLPDHFINSWYGSNQTTTCNIVLFNLWHAYLFRSSLQILISNVVASFLVCYVILRQLERE